MKVLLSCISALALTAPLALSADYSVFRVCEDQHVLRTSDGADAGHVQYIVVDPGEQRVVSTIVTGGVLGERNVVVPMTALHFGGSREVVIENVTRERLVSAPVIEQTQITHITSGHFEPALIERSSQYFGVGVRGGVEVGRGEHGVRGERGMARERANAPGGREAVTTEGGRTPQRGERAGQTAEPSTGAAQEKNAQERQQMREQRKAAAAQKEGQTATGKEGATPSEQKKGKSEAAGQPEKATKESTNEPSSSERKSERSTMPEKSSTKGMKEPGAQSGAGSSSNSQPGAVSTESAATPSSKHGTERSTTGEKKSSSSSTGTEKPSSTEHGAGSSSTSTSTPSTKVNQ